MVKARLLLFEVRQAKYFELGCALNLFANSIEDYSHPHHQCNVFGEPTNKFDNVVE